MTTKKKMKKPTNKNGSKESMAEYMKLPNCQGTPDMYSYIHFKAWKYLKRGAELYLKTDAFKMPDSTFDLEGISKGCEQLMDCCGYDPEKPFQLSISTMNDLMATFHFRMIRQNTENIRPESILDRLIYEHVKGKSQIILYNLVRY